jgi:lysophospholipid acyltransferase (LPLAT)-like uncharacterized protein
MNLLINLRAFLLYTAMLAVCRTLRFDIKGKEIVDAAKASGKNVLFAVWHRATFVMFYLYRNQNAVVITSPEPRGLVLGKVAEWMGYINITTPFSSDRFDAARGLARMIKTIREGHDAVIAVDGPKGPLYEVKPGADYLANKAGVPIILVGVKAPWRIELGWRWDRYFIPLPFSKVSVEAKILDQDLKSELLALS